MTFTTKYDVGDYLLVVNQHRLPKKRTYTTEAVDILNYELPWTEEEGQCPGERIVKVTSISIRYPEQPHWGPIMYHYHPVKCSCGIDDSSNCVTEQKAVLHMKGVE
jgi:hypothetical protein